MAKNARSKNAADAVQSNVRFPLFSFLHFLVVVVSLFIYFLALQKRFQSCPLVSLLCRFGLRACFLIGGLFIFSALGFGFFN